MRTRSGARASEPVEVVEDEEDGGTLRVFADGRAELVFTKATDWGSIARRRLYLLAFAAFFFAPLILAVLFYIFWGSAAKSLLAAGVVLYLPRFLDKSEQRGGREWEAFRLARPWRLVHRFFGTVSVREAPLDPAQQYLICMHPHGIVVLSKFFYYGGVWEALFPGVRCRILGATPMFCVPFCRELCLWLSVVNAARRFAERHLASGHSLMLYPGGSKEIFWTDPESKVTTLVLKERKGFIRLALRNGTHLVPTFVFGEKWAYDLIRPPRIIKDFFLKTLKLPVLLFWGKWGTLVPKEVPLTIVYGKPIAVARVEKPTEQQVEELHQRYEEAVRDLFDRYKGRAGYADDETLEIR